MSSGDQEEAVIDSVNSVLVNHGWSSPIDPNGTMGGFYKYKKPLMIPFHNQVRICLASKRYDYEYPENDTYMANTLAMTLLAIYAEIDSRTKSGPSHLQSMLDNAKNLRAVSGASLPVPAAAEVPGDQPSGKGRVQQSLQRTTATGGLARAAPKAISAKNSVARKRTPRGGANQRET